MIAPTRSGSSCPKPRLPRGALLPLALVAGLGLLSARPAPAGEAAADRLGAARPLVRLVRADGSPRTDLREAIDALEAFARAGSEPEPASGRTGDANAESVREAGLLLAEAEAAARRLLLYQSARLLPNGHLPQFVPPARRVFEDELATLADRLYPEDPLLSRFRPEGLTAVPLDASAPLPDAGAPPLGGLYLLRSESLACAVWAPREGDPSRFGALAAATPEADLLLEPPPARGWTAAVTLNGRAPAVAGLAEGRPLPHAWRTGAAVDALTVSWDLQPPETAPTGLVRRVVLGKSAPAWLLVADRVNVPAPAVRIGQHLLLAPGFADAAVLHLPESAEVDRDGDGILHIRTDRPGRGAAELLILPRAASSPPAVRHLHQRADGGGVWEIRHGSGVSDLLLTTYAGDPISGTYEAWTAELRGAVASWRLGPEGLRQAVFLSARDATIQRARGPAWRFAFSVPADAEIRILPGGTVSATLLAPEREPVQLDCSRRGFGEAEPARARITLLRGRTTVFRPF